VTEMLQDLIDKTVEEIRANRREDGLDMPIQAERATRQVLGRCNLTSTLILERMFREAIEMQDERVIVSDWDEFAFTSLADFIAKAAMLQMGNEYHSLLQARLEALAPTSPV